MTLLEIYQHTINSTNDYLKQHYLELPSPTIVRTDFQTNGRGQFDRIWISESGENLLCSILHKQVDMVELDSIKTQIMNTLILILSKFEINAVYKEPNDLYVNQQKICGILIETKIQNHRFDYVIIGIGLNVNQKDFNNLNAISMRLLKGMTYDIKEIYHTLVDSLFLNR